MSVTLNAPVVTTHCQEGYVNVSTGYVNIPGTSKTTPVYTSEGINLNSNENEVYYTQNINITGDFTIQLKGKNFQTGEIARFFDSSNNKIQLFYYGTYVCLVVTPGYFIYSNTVTDAPTTTQDVFIWIRRVNDLYTIQYEVATPNT